MPGVESVLSVLAECHVSRYRVTRCAAVYGYHDCAMDILTCVTELFAYKPAGAGRQPTRAPLSPLVDTRRYGGPLSPVSDVDVSTPLRRHDTRHSPPAKPASLPSLQLSDNGRRRVTKKRHKRWANSRPTTASDADAEFSDATTASFTQ